MTASTHRAATLLRANQRGILAMVVAMACFIVNDSLVKYSSESVPTGQLIFVRGALASLLVLAVAHATGATRSIGRAVQGWVLTRGMRKGELSVISPFRYTGLLWAILVGFVVWGDIPNLLAWGGIMLLIGSGVYILVAERRRPDAPAAAAADA